MRERHIGKFKLNPAHMDGDAPLHMIKLDTKELSADVGNHYLSSSSLRYRLLVIHEKKQKPLANPGKWEMSACQQTARYLTHTKGLVSDVS